MNTYRTAQIAEMIGVHPNTIRFYEEMKLLPVIPRTESGYRIFNDRHLGQLRLLRTAFRAEIISDRLRQEVYEIVKRAAAASWKQIGELLDALKYERYIDDQWEIEEIWNICNALLKTNKLEQEDWELRKNILSDIILHDYYNDYGCYDPMFDLSNELCVKADEFLAFADIMDGSGYYEKEAAHLYHKYGRDDKYVSYLETHLGKESETYVALINYYKEHDNFDGACRVAEQALEKCKDDLTEAFIYLLVDAEKREDKDKYKKLYSSAKRRRLADINRIDQALSDLKSCSMLDKTQIKTFCMTIDELSQKKDEHC